jgi:polar amino acid transport system substrate-binding protein
MTRKHIALPLLVVCCLALGGMAQAKDLLSEIKDRGEIVIATEARFAPFEMIEDGKIVGYAKDLMDAILKDGLPGVKLKQLDLPYQGMLAGLNAKRFDFVCTSVTITKERMANYAFTLPISTASVTIVKRTNDDSIKTAEDLVGKTVGIQSGAAPYFTALKDYEKDVLKPKFGQGVGEITEFIDNDEAYAALAGGRVDAVVNTVPNLAPLVKKRPDVFAIVMPPFGPPSYFAWVGRKDAGSASLVQFFSDGIAKLNKSGEMAKLQQKWFGFTMDVPSGKLPEPSL